MLSCSQTNPDKTLVMDMTLLLYLETLSENRHTLTGMYIPPASACVPEAGVRPPGGAALHLVPSPPPRHARVRDQSDSPVSTGNQAIAHLSPTVHLTPDERTSLTFHGGREDQLLRNLTTDG